MSATSDREFDLVLFGATGFTGRLVAEHVAARAPHLRWALGGRSQGKLERVREELARAVPAVEKLPLVIADSLDAAQIDGVARRAKVVCSTVGPYAQYGSPLVAACAAHGTAYCDLAGEVDWMRAMIDAHHERAARAGARIVPACGFDSIPSDLGVLLLGEHLRSRGTSLAAARLRVVSMRGGPSGGTIASGFGNAERARDPAVRAIVEDPYALNPPDERSGPDGNERAGVQRDRATGHWLAPFVMAGSNTRVVRRSNALAGFPYGRDFRYEEVSDTRGGASGLMRAVGMSAGLGMFRTLAGRSLGRAALSRFLPSPGEGPSRAEREAGRFRFVIDGTARDGSQASVRVEADRDPGYGATAILLGESALCLAEDPLTSGGGLLTPATAMGLVLVERLRRAPPGLVRFEVG